MSEVTSTVETVNNCSKLVGVLGSLSMADEISLTARGIFDGMPTEVAESIVHETMAWYLADGDRKYWRSIYLEHYIDLGFIHIDPEDSRRFQITELGQSTYENWLIS